MDETTPRQRLVVAAVDMLSRRGLSATSIRTVAKLADAPLGSTYHYFPEGKAQLVAEALQTAHAKILRGMAKIEGMAPAEGIAAFIETWRSVLIFSGFTAGCPVMAVASEEPDGPDGEQLLLLAGTIFRDWNFFLVDYFVAHGLVKERARQVAALTVATVEGATAVCRATRSIDLFDLAVSGIKDVLEADIKNTPDQNAGLGD